MTNTPPTTRSLFLQRLDRWCVWIALVSGIIPALATLGFWIWIWFNTIPLVAGPFIMFGLAFLSVRWFSIMWAISLPVGLASSLYILLTSGAHPEDLWERTGPLIAVIVWGFNLVFLSVPAFFLTVNLLS